MDALKREKTAVSYFFAIPSLAYGLFTSRLPAIKELALLDNADLGSVLLSLGLATLIGLLVSNWAIERCGSKKVTAIAAIVLCVGVVLSSLAFNLWQIAFCCLITGFGAGLCDVGVNALGIELEKRHKSLHLSFLHGISSIGGAVGALSGGLFAWLEIDPFFNSLLVLGIFLLFWRLAFVNLLDWKEKEESQPLAWKAIPFYVLVLGMLSLLAHIAEGSAAEWGSVFLRTIKKAAEDEAALAFTFFTLGMVFCRLYGDKLRRKFSDFKICLLGAILGTGGMIVVLVAHWPISCLFGYLLTGLGLGPIVPVLFSTTGKVPGLSAGRASAIISTFSYSGMLLFPPLLGYVAQVAGLTHALWIVAACCILLAPGSLVILQKEKGKI